MTAVLVDSSVVIDIATPDSSWFDWSAEALERLGAERSLVINQVIFAEAVAAYRRAGDDRLDLDAVFLRETLPFEAAALAGQAHADYRSRGGRRTAVLPDFLIGAHAAFAGYSLLTRDPGRVRTAFPGLDIIAPDVR